MKRSSFLTTPRLSALAAAWAIGCLSGVALADDRSPPPPARISYSSCRVDGRYVAMTFDDGPHAENTPRLLDILKERHIHATFFMVGECAAKYPKIVQRIAAEGHEIGNHSWSHPDLAKMTDDAVRDQIQRTQDAIVKGCGVMPTLLRPPYGAFTARQRGWAHGLFGYKTVLWDVDPEDWKIRDSGHVEDEIFRQARSGSIILSHDIHKTTVDAMPGTLDALIGEGFQFVTVSELIAMDRPMANSTNGHSAVRSSAEGSANGKPGASLP